MKSQEESTPQQPEEFSDKLGESEIVSPYTADPNILRLRAQREKDYLDDLRHRQATHNIDATD